MTERLPRINIAQMDLDDRNREGGQRIAQGQRVVSQGPWVNDHSGGLLSLLLEKIDERPLVIRLKIEQRDPVFSGKAAQALDNPGQGDRAINSRLPFSQTIQVRSIDH